MTDPTIRCPQCHSDIKLTESLAAPLLESTKQDYERRLAEQQARAAQREAAVAAREAKLEQDESALEARVSDGVKQGRAKIVAEEATKAKRAVAVELEQKGKEISELQQVLTDRDQKLADAQQAQAALLKKQRELDDAKRELDLTIEKQVQEHLAAVRAQARQEAEASLTLKVKEREQTIVSMQQQIEELKRKAEQGSQQLQGEVQELELEALLAQKFPQDLIHPVPKGEHGGDVLQHVRNGLGQVCGVVLWESKRTKHWSDGWLAKLREDQRRAKAEVAVLVSRTLPKDVEVFQLVDGVWVAHPTSAYPIASVIRHTLMEISASRLAAEGQQTKMEMVYDYLMGARFRQRVEAIVEGFTTMQEDLEKERKAMMKQWAKRETQIERVMQATVGMYGDLQGIAGKTLKEIDGLELTALDGPAESLDPAPERLFD